MLWRSALVYHDRGTTGYRFHASREQAMQHVKEKIGEASRPLGVQVVEMRIPETKLEFARFMNEQMDLVREGK